MNSKINTRAIVKSLAGVALMGIMAFGCESSDNVNPKSNPNLAGQGAGDTIHEGPLNICGDVITGRLVDASGNAGSGDIFGPANYGTYSMMRADDDMIVTYSLDRGYFATDMLCYYGPTNALPRLQNGNVDAENLPLRWSVPSRGMGEVTWPYNPSVLCPADIVFVGEVTIVQLDFLGNAFGETNVYFEGTDVGTNGWQSVDFCASLCPGQQPPCAIPSVTPTSDLSAYHCQNGNGQVKVNVCHLPPGNPANMQEICISVSALDAHILEFKPANNPCMGHHSGCHIGPCDPCGPGTSALNVPAADPCLGNGGNGGNGGRNR